MRTYSIYKAGEKSEIRWEEQNCTSCNICIYQQACWFRYILNKRGKHFIMNTKRLSTKRSSEWRDLKISTVIDMRTYNVPSLYLWPENPGVRLHKGIRTHSNYCRVIWRTIAIHCTFKRYEQSRAYGQDGSCLYWVPKRENDVKDYIWNTESRLRVPKMSYWL